MRAADYDDWVTPTPVSADGRQMHGLNGDILVWNPVTQRRHELTSMGVRVNADTLATAAGGSPIRLHFLEIALSSGYSQRRHPAEHRRRHRAITHIDATPAESPHWRGQCNRLAADSQGHVRRTQSRLNKQKCQALSPRLRQRLAPTFAFATAIVIANPQRPSYNACR